MLSVTSILTLLVFPPPPAIPAGYIAKPSSASSPLRTRHQYDPLLSFLIDIGLFVNTDPLIVTFPFLSSINLDEVPISV